MITNEIQSDRLKLFRITSAQLHSLVGVGSELEFNIEPGWIENQNDLDESLLHAADDPWWLPFLIRLGDESRVIGVCLHKGPPDESGAVEIAYAIAATYRGQGFAREAVSALINETRYLPEVTSIIAHTLPQRHASSRVLEHCGFIRIADIHDLDIGPLWKWQLAVR